MLSQPIHEPAPALPSLRGAPRFRRVTYSV
jgi:hypothetical protein